MNAATSTAGYDGTPTVDNTKLTSHNGAVINGKIAGVFGAADSAIGVATGNHFTYSEVGYFNMAVNGVYDSSFTAIDKPNDCTNDFSNTLVGV